MRNDNLQEKVSDALLDCELHWLKMRIPRQKIEEMSAGLEAHVNETVREGGSVESVIGPDVDAFAEAWAEESGADPDLSPEPMKYTVQGWILSLTACSAILAGISHVLEWSLYVPVAWMAGIYLLLIGIWFLGEHISDAIEIVGSQRHAFWKRLLAVMGLILAFIMVSVLGALFFQVVGPAIPFVWPWYATIASAAVSVGILFIWLRGTN